MHAKQNTGVNPAKAGISGRQYSGPSEVSPHEIPAFAGMTAKPGLRLIIVTALALGLSACGKKGPLEPRPVSPNQSSIAQ